jgi:tetratricopeptide (TPR) repeat protein
VLEASKHIQDSTDFIGILGGRYKRKYLSSYLQSDIDKAIELYQQACTRSIENNNSEQVYYHAINLAFLHLHNDDKNKMKEFAMLALEHANKETQEEYWKYATIAEAELYLGNFEVAKTNYHKAIELANNRWRDISSMYINAINGAGKLNNQVWQAEIENIFRPK